MRASTEEVREMLYGAFEKHQYYSLKDLVQITQQPVVSASIVIVYSFKWENGSMMKGFNFRQLLLHCKVKSTFLRT